MYETFERFRITFAENGKRQIYASLPRRRNLTPVSKQRRYSLFWAPDKLNELPEMRFEFPLQPD